MTELINLLAAHARACHLRLAQIDVELRELREMTRERTNEHGRLTNQFRAAQTMLQHIHDDLPEGEGQAALGRLIERLEREEEPDDAEDPPWDDDDTVELPRAPGSIPKDFGPSQWIDWRFWRR